jgi:two-component system response regulator PfeR
MNSFVSLLRILIVEDDPALGTHLYEQLSERGYAVALCREASRVVERVREESFDLLVLDILLPNGHGLDVLEQIRSFSAVPVILISALGSEPDRILGFTKGADDYLPKPFSLDELNVRIGALLRRIAFERNAVDSPSNALKQGSLCFEPVRSDVSYKGHSADLTTSEYRVLELLNRYAGEVLSKPVLYQEALQRAYSRHDRSLDMHVSHIRRKLQGIGCSDYEIRTAWGKGYVLVCSST